MELRNIPLVMLCCVESPGVINYRFKYNNNNNKDIPGKHSIDSLQKTAILGISHIIRKVLQCEAWSLSGGDHRCFKRITRKKRPVTREDNNNNNNNNNVHLMLYWSKSGNYEVHFGYLTIYYTTLRSVTVNISTSMCTQETTIMTNIKLPHVSAPCFHPQGVFLKKSIASPAL